MKSERRLSFLYRVQFREVHGDHSIIVREYVGSSEAWDIFELWGKEQSSLQNSNVEFQKKEGRRYIPIAQFIGCRKIVWGKLIVSWRERFDKLNLKGL